MTRSWKVFGHLSQLISLALFCLFFPLSRFWIVAAASLCFGDADVGGAQKLMLLLLVCGLALV